ncbi:hypothetical protein PTSG_03917 [Salpingoeca rosetta]|uniref:Beta-hexosaminidase n=1 Tax=Salpingoeca rosetta (strain ATCC 50818 / BSB-021) TaxID=946362 RepID=F2U791_SALR5|nr:uncharacterized protein PTSG_03917 [Salpingoeca rosetta]EGD83308.1 hypothetical protein PTSG_03917 [Salpingoeca rosetta]|eukprot:XP_004994812.1 hypothetical protein PTSG_03917 [Salpingoeca rosetta]
MVRLVQWVVAAVVAVSVAATAVQGDGALHDPAWRRVNQSDCPYDDTGDSCTGATVEGCKVKCAADPACGGFNYPHGIMKKTDCSAHISTSPTVDLYLLVKDISVNWPPIWPMPKSYTNGTTNLKVDGSKFGFFTTTPSADLTAAFSRFRPLFFPHRTSASPAGATRGVDVTVHNSSVPLQLYADESYTLSVPADGGNISLTANTVYGAYHGLQTLSQLISFDFTQQEYVIPGAPWKISDAPRFPHREVLIDSSRHFEPVETIKDVITSLTYAKINTVHWHLVDSQSFPFISPTYPDLAGKGSYSLQERYTVDDVADVVEFARQRGVRVVVEIDTPGHAASWCAGHPEICPSAQCQEPLNPATNTTFNLIAGLFKDLTGGARGSGLFPDNLMHLGGDEVNTKCWSESPTISKWMQDHGLTPDGAYAYFVNRTQAIARGYGRDVIGWEEIWDHFGTSLDKSTIIHQWLPKSSIAINATKAGYRVLWSTDGAWYLDGLSVTWQEMYEQEPCTGIDDHLCDTLVLGGGGCMWGETVDTSDIQQTIWPRMAAIAERLWSPRSVISAAQADARFRSFRCLLNRRGIAAAPANNPTAREAPPHPGGCLEQ